MILNRGDAAHFLRRVGFGGRPDEIALLTGMDSDAAVDMVIDAQVDPLPQPPFLTAYYDEEWKRYQDAPGWWIQRMVDSTWVDRAPADPSPLVEKLTLFWHGHFATSMNKVHDFPKMFEQNQVLRSGCLGDFEALTQQVAIGGAMLVYLDNATNVASAPQENFARELMELFTMGVGNYDENDVVEMARAWTGHNIVGWDRVDRRMVNEYLFVGDDHDDGQKTIFGLRRNWDGPDTITEIVKGSKATATARFITAKLYSHFVHAQPSAAIIDELAPVFVATGASIAELLRAILNHSSFWDERARFALVKPPVDMAADLWKRIGLPAEGPSFGWELGRTGQQLFEPPNVAGWGENGYWLSTATAWARQLFINQLPWQIRNAGVSFLPELSEMTGAEGARHLLDWFGIVEPTPTTLSSVADWIDTAPAWELPFHGAVVAALTPEFHVI